MIFKWIVTPRQRCDLEMLLNGAFHPLKGFLTKIDYDSVLNTMRLQNQSPWPIPITLDVNSSFADKVSMDDIVELYDFDNTLLATMKISDKWQADKNHEALKIFNTLDIKHPGVNYLLNTANSFYLGGNVETVQLPRYYDFTTLRHTPDTLKALFASLGWERIVAFQTRNPMHRAHMELTLRAAKETDSHILLHPVIGMTKPGDIDYLTRVHCYQKILAYYPKNTVQLSLVPLAMRMAGPREALWHAIIRKNYGCTHFIIGRDHAGPGTDSQGKPFYDPYDAQKLVSQFQNDIGITVVPFQEMLYVKERDQYCTQEEIKPNETSLNISGTELRDALLHEKNIPHWFSFPEIIEELRSSHIPKHKKGFTLFFTGLSGAGKTVLSQAVYATLRNYGFKNVTVLDSDATRRILAQDLGFSKTDRNVNIQRLGFVAAEITKVGGIAICAAIAPYAEMREENRRLISQYGGYIEVYLETSFSECAKRDTKGLYAKAIRGEITSFTGYNDPYEPPLYSEIRIDTANKSIEESVKLIIDFLTHEGFIKISNLQHKKFIEDTHHKTLSENIILMENRV